MRFKFSNVKSRRHSLELAGGRRRRAQTEQYGKNNPHSLRLLPGRTHTHVLHSWKMIRTLNSKAFDFPKSNNVSSSLKKSDRKKKARRFCSHQVCSVPPSYGSECKPVDLYVGILLLPTTHH